MKSKVDRTQVYIEKHSTVDKSFEFNIDDVWAAQVDFDDQDHICVEAATLYLRDVILNHWKRNEFNAYFKALLKKEWKNDKELQEEYPDIQDYLKQRI